MFIVNFCLTDIVGVYCLIGASIILVFHCCFFAVYFDFILAPIQIFQNYVASISNSDNIVEVLSFSSETMFISTVPVFEAH